MKKVLLLLSCATMLCYTGVTKAEPAPEKVSKTVDVPTWDDFYNLDMLPGVVMIQGDIYYSETISYCDFVEESIDQVYLEVETPPPLSMSTYCDLPIKVSWRG